MMVELYKYDGEAITEKDIYSALARVGCRKGDAIFVHSDLAVFGKLMCFDRNLFLGSICDAIKESVGAEGTVIMPTFTYSFCDGHPFDVKNSKSKVGVLSEYFRNLTDVVRTIHPIFSVAIWGKQKEEVAAIGKDSFDGRSIFGKLHEMNGKIVFLGARFQTCTYIHYIEQTHGVPYRYMKRFTGKINAGGRVYDDECTFFVRYLEKNVKLNTVRLEKHLLTKGIMKECELGDGRILVVPSGILFEEGWRLLDQDIFFFLKAKPDL